MVTYSKPYRLFLVKDPETGKRRQLKDEANAKGIAKDIASRTGSRLKDILVRSTYLYVEEYRKGARCGRRINTRKKTRFEAQEWVRERIRASSGPYSSTQQLFRLAVEEWLDELRMLRRSDKTLTDYRSQSGFWIRFFGSRQVDAINKQDIVSFFRKRSDKTGSNGKRPSARLLNLNRTLLRSFFRWAMKQGYCEFDPTEDLQKWKEDQVEPRILAADEIQGLLEACRESYSVLVVRNGYRDYAREIPYTPPQWLYPIVLTALTTLLRQKNILELTWEQVDFHSGTIRIPAEKTKARTEIVIPMSDELQKCLMGLTRGIKNAPVFGAKLGSVRRSFRNAVKRAGISGVTFHCLRKTGTDFLLRSGFGPETVQKYGGWKSVGVMMKHYRMVSLAEKQDAAACLDDMVRQVGA